MDLGAGPLRTFFKVTLPAILPAVMAAALLVFALSIDDYVVTSFVAGVGRHHAAPADLLDGEERGLPGDQRRLDLLLLATALLLLACLLLEQGRSGAGGARCPAASASPSSARRS